jgi:hypothetical protein
MEPANAPSDRELGCAGSIGDPGRPRQGRHCQGSARGSSAHIARLRTRGLSKYAAVDRARRMCRRWAWSRSSLPTSQGDFPAGVILALGWGVLSVPTVLTVP